MMKMEYEEYYSNFVQVFHLFEAEARLLREVTRSRACYLGSYFVNLQQRVLCCSDCSIFSDTAGEQLSPPILRSSHMWRDACI